MPNSLHLDQMPVGQPVLARRDEAAQVLVRGRAGVDAIDAAAEPVGEALQVGESCTPAAATQPRAAKVKRARCRLARISSIRCAAIGGVTKCVCAGTHLPRNRSSQPDADAGRRAAGRQGAFDLRHGRALRALVQLMLLAGLNFVVLGEDEQDCGDLARRLGARPPSGHWRGPTSRRCRRLGSSAS